MIGLWWLDYFSEIFNLSRSDRWLVQQLDSTTAVLATWIWCAWAFYYHHSNWVRILWEKYKQNKSILLPFFRFFLYRAHLVRPFHSAIKTDWLQNSLEWRHDDRALVKIKSPSAILGGVSWERVGGEILKKMYIDKWFFNLMKAKKINK